MDKPERAAPSAAAKRQRFQFFQQFGVNIVAALLLVGLSIAIGTIGYRHFAGMAWIDAFANAAMIVSGMGPLDNLTTNPERALTSMKKARDVMAAGYSFGVFVEGTRGMPGELLPFKKGAFHLALQMGAPIVPVAIKNTDWMMGKRTGVAYAGEIEMVLLPPIQTTGLAADNDVMDLLVKTRIAIADELKKSV